MAEERTEELFDLKASYQFVVDQVRKNGGHGLGACSVCASQAWIAEAVYRSEAIDTEPPLTRAPAYLYKSSFSFWSTSPTIPLLALTCMNCGHVRVHNLAWIKAEMAKVLTDG